MVTTTPAMSFEQSRSVLHGIVPNGALNSNLDVVDVKKPDVSHVNGAIPSDVCFDSIEDTITAFSTRSHILASHHV